MAASSLFVTTSPAAYQSGSRSARNLGPDEVEVGDRVPTRAHRYLVEYSGIYGESSSVISVQRDKHHIGQRSGHV